jgi:hypothetical protein
MRKLLVAFFIVVFAVQLHAQVSELAEPGKAGSSLSAFCGLGPTFWGYRDARFVGTDKGDYRKAAYRYTGFELKRMATDDREGNFSDVVLGGGVVLYGQEGFSQKTLYAVPTKSISEEKVPGDDNAGLLNTVSINPSFFFGLNKKWFSVELGFAFVLSSIDEKHRVKLSPSGTETSVDGRGWIWSDSSSSLTFSARFGLEDNVNLRLDFMRNEYDPVNGTTLMVLRIPLRPKLALEAGSFLYPTQAVYLEPEFAFGHIALSGRIGTIVNPESSQIQKLAIADSVFGGLSLSYTW